MIKKLTLLLLFASYFHFSNAQSLYFPPKTGDTWESLSPDSMGWCMHRVDSLYRFLEEENTKAFIVLKDGKIVLEKYFDGFTADSSWYWASAGKTLTAFLVGQAQEKGFLSIHDTTSKYLGKGWTSLTPAQEDKITIWHQLTMTSGLDDGGDVFCTDDTCLTFKADPGTRWAYHNAPYTLLRDVLESAVGFSDNIITTSSLKNPTGMKGIWLDVDYNNIYYSQPRSMARFGLLIQNHGVWDGDTLLHDQAYFNQMINTSQQLNKSYGYLWWLNGKPSYMFPGSQFVVPNSYAPDAPADMFSALGKNGQILSIAPSKGLVVVRMGDASGNGLGDISTVLCNDIWKKLLAAMCGPNSVQQPEDQNQVAVYPNPASGMVTLTGLDPASPISLEVWSLAGEKLIVTADSDRVDLSGLPGGMYVIRVAQGEKQYHLKVIKP